VLQSATADDFRLGVHRINLRTFPSGSDLKGPVFLNHGVLSVSFMYFQLSKVTHVNLDLLWIVVDKNLSFLRDRFYIGKSKFRRF
jgi:hypothetical protein